MQNDRMRRNCGKTGHGSILWKITRRTCRRIRDILYLYRTCHLSRSAAGLSYYLLLALFPMVVCFSILLYRPAGRSGILHDDAARLISSALDGIAGFSWENPEGISSNAIFAAALTLLLSASAGAFRCLAVTASEMIHAASDTSPVHDVRRGRGSRLFGAVFGYLFATVLFFAVYAAIFVLLLWDALTERLSHLLPSPALTRLLSGSRYAVLLLLFFALCYALLRLLPSVSVENTAIGTDYRRKHTVPGALFCTIGLCAATVYFSIFIRGSARYSLVYGSLASMILFLSWIFVCGNVLLIGAAVNAVWDGRQRQNR